MFYIYADGQMIYHLANPDLYLVDPTLSMELGKAGSLEFGILEDHAAYNKLQQMKTIITVEYDNQEIFRGRVLSKKREFNNTRTVYCEGDLAYLVDSVQKCEKYSGTTHALFRKIIAAHNARVEPYKRFTVGNITIEDRPIELNGKSEDTNVGSINYKQIAIDSIVGEWNNTYDFIETCLIDWCGGYLKTRYVNGVNYIDYVQSYTRDCTQPISVGLNMLDLEEEVNAEELFTVLIPLGDDNLTIASVNNGSDELADANAVAQYGRIVQTHVFPNVNSASTLLENARRYLASNVNVPRTLTLKAIDLHMFNKDIMQIDLGTRVQIKSTTHNISEYLTCTEIEYDFEDPTNTTYTFGSQKQTLTQRYREDKRKQNDLYGNSGGRGGAGGISGWHLTDIADAIGGEAAEEQDKKIEEFYNAYIDKLPGQGEITLGTLYKRVEDAIEVLRSECKIFIDSDPDHSNIDMQVLYRQVDTNTNDISETQTNFLQYADENDARITLQAKAITKNADDITSTKSTVAEIQLKANTNGDSIAAINADIIELNGIVNAVVANEASIDRLKSKISQIDTLSVLAGYVSGAWSVGGALSASSISVGDGVPVLGNNHVHNVSVNSSGTVTIGTATTTVGNNSFNIADTQFYKDGVSAAKTAGAQTATLRSLGVNSVGSPYTANNKKYIDATLAWSVQATKGDGTLYTISDTIVKAVDATGAYNLGVTDGVAKFRAKTVYIRGASETVYDSDGSVSGTNVGGSVSTTYLYVSYDGQNFTRWNPSQGVYWGGSSYTHNLRTSGKTRYKSGGSATYYEKIS